MDSMALFTAVIDNAPQLVGFILPPIVEVLNKEVKEDKERFLVSAAVCLIAATLLKWNELLYGSPVQLITSFGVIFTESQVVFKLYFNNSWARWKIQSMMGVEEGIDKPG